LRRDGLVTARRTGQTIYCRIAEDGVMTLLQALSEVMQRRRLMHR
jgi:DNA-binding transcriptional ArsR family regulator